MDLQMMVMVEQTHVFCLGGGVCTWKYYDAQVSIWL